MNWVVGDEVVVSGHRQARPRKALLCYVPVAMVELIESGL